MFPGFQYFYNGLQHADSHNLHHSSADDPHRHGTNLSEHHTHHHDHYYHEPMQDQSSWIPAILQFAGTAALKVAANVAVDAMLGKTSEPHHQDSHHQAPHHPHSVGDPNGAGFTRQTTGFTCAVVSQKMILDQFHLHDSRTGEPLSEAQLVYDATVNGWLTDHGTSMENFNKLLDHYGVPSHEGHDWKHLIADLAAGHQVAIAVNADVLWNEHSFMTDFWNLFGNSPNHALVVKGLKVDDHGKVLVVVNDPGQMNGAGVEYPVEHFQAALDSASFHYIATDHAPRNWAPEATLQKWAGEHVDLSGLIEPSFPGSSFADLMLQMTGIEKGDFLRSL